MASLDIKEKVRSHLSAMPHNRNRAYRDEDISTDKVKVKLSSKAKWSDIINGVELEGINSTVKVEKNPNTPNSAEALPQIHTAKESDIIGKVTLTEGMIKGLNKMMKLSLEDTVFKDVLGNNVDINLGKQVTELKKDKMTIGVSLEVGGHGASATIKTKKKVYKGHFECDVALSGNVMIDNQDGALQQNISEVIRGSVLHVKGVLEFIWEHEQNVNMGSS